MGEAKASNATKQNGHGQEEGHHFLGVEELK